MLAIGLMGPAVAQSPVEKIAYDYCYLDVVTDSVTCKVVVANANGTGVVLGPDGMNRSWSPDGSRIAFESRDEVHVWNLVDGTPANLTNHPAHDGSPAWSPDWRQIAFESNRDDLGGLYIVQADGSGVTPLTRNGGGWPAWSPEGARIAYDCQIELYNGDICTIDVHTGLVARLTTDPAGDSGAAWSPDGARIAFATTRYEASPRSRS